MKMAGVFMSSTCTRSLRTGIIPCWMTCLNLTLSLLFSLGHCRWASLVFPSWALLICQNTLLVNLRRPPVDRPSATSRE